MADFISNTGVANRVQSTHEEIKKNIAHSSRSAATNVSQLHAGEVIEVLVNKGLKMNEINLIAAKGKFVSNNDYNLKDGDKVAVKILQVDQKILAQLLSVNQNILQFEAPIIMTRLQHYPREARVSMAPKDQVSVSSQMVSTSAAAVVKSTSTANNRVSELPLKEFSGSISYLQSSKINPKSYLSHIVSAASIKSTIPISFTVANEQKWASSSISFTGTVTNIEGGNNQMIRTEFGIINVPGSDLPEGRALKIEVISLNDVPVPRVNIPSKVEDFCFRLQTSSLFNAPFAKRTASASIKAGSEHAAAANDRRLYSGGSWDSRNNQARATISLGSALDNAKGLSAYAQEGGGKFIPDLTSSGLSASLIRGAEAAKESELRQGKMLFKVLKDNTEAISKEQQEDTSRLVEDKQKSMQQRDVMNNLLSRLDHKELSKILESYREVRSLLTATDTAPDAKNAVNVVTIPFFNGQKIDGYPVKLESSDANHKKFSIELNLESGPLNIEGLLTFYNNRKTPTAFDLVIRSSNILDIHIQKHLSSLFYSHQQMTGIMGSFSLEVLSRNDVK